MKKLMMVLVPVLLLAGSAFGQDDAIQKFFGKYLTDNRFTVVYVSPKMFKMFSRMDWDSVSHDIREAASQITSLRILTTEDSPLQFYDEAIHTIDQKEYEPLVTMRDHGQEIKFLAKENGNTVQELVMLCGSKDEFVLMSFVGNINLDEMSRLGSDLNVNGMQYLKGLKKNHN